MKKVKLLKDSFLEGRLLPPGKLVDVSDEVALVMIANGNASPVLAEEAAPEVKENAVSAEVQSADEQPEPAAVQAPEPKLGRRFEMNLKDQMAADVDTVFFNFDEMAESITINGRGVPAIADTDTLSGFMKYGIHVGEKLVFLRALDFPGRFRPGEPLLLEKEKWFVVSCEGDDNVLQLVLERHMR